MFLSYVYYLSVFTPSLTKIIENKISQWPIDHELREGLDNIIKEKDIPWLKNPLENVWKQIQQSLTGRPFSDMGDIRKIEWKSLGIEWLVEFKNNHTTECYHRRARCNSSNYIS